MPQTSARRGWTTLPDASGTTWSLAIAEMPGGIDAHSGKVANIKDYKSAMPPFEGVLTDAEIIAVLSWIKAQWPVHIRAEQEKVNKQYAESRGQR